MLRKPRQRLSGRASKLARTLSHWMARQHEHAERQLGMRMLSVAALAASFRIKQWEAGKLR